jgi:superfamily II DNA or RNA helicase
MPQVLALTEDGRISFCTAPEDQRGKGRCNHIAHAREGQSSKEFLEEFGNPSKTNPIIQKPHNQKAYKEATDLLNKYGKCSVVQPTGTGKSAVLSAIADDYRNSKCVLLVPQSKIGEQFMGHPHENRTQPIIFKTYQDVSVQFNKDHGQFLKYQSEHLQGQVDLIMLDELHRSGADLWQDAVESFISYCGSKKVKILGASATPNRDNNNGAQPIEKFCGGHTAGNLGLEEAFKNGILVTPNYYSITPLDRAEKLFYHEMELFNKYKNTDKYAFQRFLGTATKINNKYQKDYDQKQDKIIKKALDDKLAEKDKANKGLKVLVFCENLDEVNKGFGKNFSDKLNKLFPDRKVHVGSYTYKSNSNDFDNFVKPTPKGSIEILLSVSRLNEGLHAPDTDTAVFGRGTDSNIVYSQQLGRVLSTGNSELDGKPLVLDFADNYKKSDYDWDKINEIENQKHPDSNCFKDTNKDFREDLHQLQLARRMESSTEGDRICQIDNKFYSLDEEIKRVPYPTYKQDIDEIVDSVKHGETLDDAYFAHFNKHINEEW